MGKGRMTSPEIHQCYMYGCHDWFEEQSGIEWDVLK